MERDMTDVSDKLAKLGKKYEQVVADTLQQMDPGATVSAGEWVSGPDSPREIDVLVTGHVDGSPFRIQIECKDYDWTKCRIGIGVIDAVESKHRDLGVNLSFVCSNAGAVQERLGHSTIALTMDTYSHLFPRSDDADELAAAEHVLLG